MLKARDMAVLAMVIMALAAAAIAFFTGALDWALHSSRIERLVAGGFFGVIVLLVTAINRLDRISGQLARRLDPD